MNDLQQVFERIQEKRKQLKELRQSYKDALDTTPGYKKLLDDMKSFREQKKNIEAGVRSQFASDMEDLKTDLDTDMQMMSDLALTKLMKGETIEITDKYDANYEPVFSVKFKKIN